MEEYRRIQFGSSSIEPTELVTGAPSIIPRRDHHSSRKLINHTGWLNLSYHTEKQRNLPHIIAKLSALSTCFYPSGAPSTQKFWGQHSSWAMKSVVSCVRYTPGRSKPPYSVLSTYLTAFSQPSGGKVVSRSPTLEGRRCCSEKLYGFPKVCKLIRGRAAFKDPLLTKPLGNIRQYHINNETQALHYHISIRAKLISIQRGLRTDASSLVNWAVLPSLTS